MTNQFKPSEILSSRWLYVDLIVLYIAWSIIGVLLEGTYTRLSQGVWETHVISMIGPFCIIYGFGAVMYYIASAFFYYKPFIVRLLIFASIGTFFELLCGLLLMYALNMRAWDYTDSYFNFKGIICLEMFLVWGLLGMAFCHFLPQTSALLSKLHRQPFGILAAVAAFILLADLCFTAVCITRWDKRAGTIEPQSYGIKRVLDERYPDEYMQNRFIEWRFLGDDPSVPAS